MGFLSSACVENAAVQVLGAIGAAAAGRCSKFLLIMDFRLSWLVRKWFSCVIGKLFEF